MISAQPLRVRDLAAELRRAWIVPVVGAIVGATVMLLASNQVERQYTQRLDIRASSDAQIAAALGVPEIVPTWKPGAVAQDYVSRLDAEQPDQRCACRLVASDTTGSLSIYATRGSAEEAVEAAEDIASQIIAELTLDFTTRAKALRTGLQRDVDRLEQQLPSSGAATVDQLYLLIEYLSVSRRLASLNQMTDTDQIGVETPVAVGVADADVRSASSTYALLGAVLGAALAAAFIVYRRATTSRVVSKVDLSRSGLNLPFAPRVKAGERLGAGTAAGLAGVVRAATNGTNRGVLVVSPSGDDQVRMLATDLAGALEQYGERVETVIVDHEYDPTSPDLFTVAYDEHALSASAAGVVAAQRFGGVVLVGRERSSTVEEFAEASALVEQVGGKILGVVLVN